MQKDHIHEIVSVSPKNASKTNGGIFEGWGTSLCWWANRIGYSDVLSQKAADLFYGENGLRMNIMRYNIGGGDDPAHDHIQRTDSAVPGWLKWDETVGDYIYDYTADSNQLNVMERAVKASGERAIVEVFSNSPPYFMTVSGCSSGGSDPNTDNLRKDCYDRFADYLVHVTKYIQDNLGIRVTSLSPMNEPNTPYWNAYSGKQEGCHFDPGASQSEIIEKTFDALKKHGVENVIVSASDETSTARQIEAYFAYTERARNAVGRINTHSYGTEKIEELGRLRAEKGFNLWMSEVDGDGVDGTLAGEMGSALWFGKKIISDINALMPSAWVMWQAIDRHISENGYNGRRDVGMANRKHGFWGLAFADHDREEIILSQKYYGMGQFSRYIAPGSTIIKCNSDVIAAYDASKQELAVVALNTSAEEKNVFFDLSEFSKKHITIKTYRTSGSMEDGEHWAKIDIAIPQENGFSALLKANSITTFVISGIEI